MKGIPRPRRFPRRPIERPRVIHFNMMWLTRLDEDGRPTADPVEVGPGEMTMTQSGQ